MTRLPRVITPRTDAEWPPDHPLRRGSRVMSNTELARTPAYLICALVGEHREPPPADDHDVEALDGLVDLPEQEGVKYVDDPEETVLATVTMPTREVEPEELPEDAEAEGAEVPEGEAAPEGAEAPAEAEAADAGSQSTTEE